MKGKTGYFLPYGCAPPKKKIVFTHMLERHKNIKNHVSKKHLVAV